MWKLYGGFSLHRFEGLGSFGIFALSVAFGLTGLLVLSSCDDDNEMTPAPTQTRMEMRGFYISVNQDGETVCSNEDIDVLLEGDESTGKLDVGIVAAGEEFGGAQFQHAGSKLTDSDGNETIVSSYVSVDNDGNFVYPGLSYLASRTDTDIADETIFTGYWTGHAYRPSDHPVIICPYVMVPRTVLETAASGCTATTNAEDVHTGLRRYLVQDNGSGGMELRACSNVFDEVGRVSLMQR